MFTLEFEVPMERFNHVMDALIWNGASLEWVYCNSPRESAVFRASVPEERLYGCLLRLAEAAGQTEVTIIEKSGQERYIHEAFLATVEVSSGRYPVMILLEYRKDPFTPSRITVGLLPSSPQELVDAVMRLTVGRISMTSTRLLKRVVTDDLMLLRLEYLPEALPEGHSVVVG